MSEVARDSNNEILDKNGNRLELAARYKISALQEAHNRHQQLSRIAETALQNNPAAKEAYTTADEANQAGLEEDALSGRATQHYRENRKGYEQAAHDEDTARPERQRQAELQEPRNQE